MKNQAIAFFSVLFLQSAIQADIIETFGTGTNQFNMIFVPIGNPGNAPDTTGNPNPAGSVGYEYLMGKYEVSRDMIIKANATGNLGISIRDMVYNGGNGPHRPATGVDWNSAARFVNWLNISQGYSPAYKFDIQPGQPGYSALANITLWQASDPGYNAANLFRNSQAKFFLPSMDEWYKAAFYDPKKDGGTGGYWNFATGSDTLPTTVIDGTDGTAPNTAVWDQTLSEGPADIMNAGGLSSYGVMAMAGNVWEWEETELDLVNDNPSTWRGVRGGNWTSLSHELPATYRITDLPRGSYADYNFLGFRVASVPEPSSAALLMLGAVGLTQRRKKLS
jgi:sulfatase modifying factor 1